MRFLMLVKHAENAAMSGAPPKEFMDEMAKLAGDAAKSGTLLHSGGLSPTAKSTRVRRYTSRNRCGLEDRVGQDHRGTRIVRDVGLAEELAQDALVAALQQWPESGVPDNPDAWLMAITGEVNPLVRFRR
jgi:hypothetical protein